MSSGGHGKSMSGRGFTSCLLKETQTAGLLPYPGEPGGPAYTTVKVSSIFVILEVAFPHEAYFCFICS